MKAGWKKTQLGDVIEIHDSRRIPLSGAQRSQRQGKYPYYGAQSIIDYIDDYIFDGKFLLIAEDGENLRSRKEPIASFATGKFWVNNHAHIVTAKPDRADDYFIKACLNHANLAAYVTGAAQPKLSQGNLKLIEITLPDLPTQHKIAGILSAYDDLIENNLRRINILEEMAQSLYREWFVHFRFPGHESVKFVDSPLGQIPKGWEVKKLGQVAKIVMGLSPKGDTYNDQGDGMPLVNGPVEFAERFTKRIKWTTSPTKTCKAGDLVVCVRGSTTGKNVKSDGEYCLGRGVCSISSEHQSFVDQMFANELPTLLGMTSGSTFPSWTGPVLQSHPVISPPKTLVAEFDRMALPMSDTIQRLAYKNDNLRRTRDLLLPKLLESKK